MRLRLRFRVSPSLLGARGSDGGVEGEAALVWPLAQGKRGDGALELAEQLRLRRPDAHLLGGARLLGIRVGVRARVRASFSAALALALALAQTLAPTLAPTLTLARQPLGPARVVRCHRTLGAPKETVFARDEGAEVGVGARLEPEVGQRRPDRVDLPVGEI